MTVHRIDLSGDYRTTVCDVARRLLAGGADPGDTVETWRNGKLSMSGVIGEAAKWTVGSGPYGLRLVRHAASVTGRWAAETPSAGITGPEAAFRPNLEAA